MTFTIRAADAARDAAACAAIYAPFVTDSLASFELEPPSEREMADRIARYGSSHGWLVSELDGDIAGYAYGSPHRTRPAYASSCDVGIYVRADAAGRGVGRALYSKLLPQLAKNYHAAFAGIVLPNEASVALHEAMGFEHLGTYREVGWKQGAWQDVGWWQRLL